MNKLELKENQFNSMKLDFTAVAFELANPFPTSICSVGMVKVREGQIVDSFTSIVKPFPFIFSKQYVDLHGIVESECMKAPDIGEIINHIGLWLNNQIIVSYQFRFVKPIIVRILESYKLKVEIKDYLSAYEIAKVGRPLLANHQFSNVYKKLFNKDIKSSKTLETAIATAEIVLNIVREWGPPDFERMVAALYGETSEFRTINYGKVRLRSLFPIDKFKDKTELLGTGFIVLNELKDMSKLEVQGFIKEYGGKVSEKVNDSTSHIVIEGIEKWDYNHQQYHDILYKVTEATRNGKDITILSGNQFVNLFKTIKKQEESVQI